MDKKEIDEFFEEYIKTYVPYKDKKFYQLFIENLKDRYINNLYNVTPHDLKEMYEKQNIPINVYTQILIQLGVPEEIVKKLTIREKSRFLETISDFQRFKGSIEFFKKVAGSFFDKVNIYELYAGDDDEHGWIMKPVLIYKGSEFQEQIKKPISYNEVYQEIPSFLIPLKRLIDYKVDGLATFPIKTNIILLEYDFTVPVNDIQELILSSFLKKHGNDEIHLYFDENIFKLKLREIYFIWYYILSKYHKTIWHALKNLDSKWISETEAYDLEELDKVMVEYQKIETANDLEVFLRKYVTPKIDVKITRTITIKNMEESLKKINKDIFNFLENRLFQRDNIDLKKESIKVMNQIYNSIIQYQFNKVDNQFSFYFNFFLSSLPLLRRNIDDTCSYLLFYNFKPYHVELLKRANEGVRVDDLAVLDDKILFDIEIIYTSFVSEVMDKIIIDIETNSINEIGFYDEYVIPD